MTFCRLTARTNKEHYRGTKRVPVRLLQAGQEADHDADSRSRNFHCSDGALAGQSCAQLPALRPRGAGTERSSFGHLASLRNAVRGSSQPATSQREDLSAWRQKKSHEIVCCPGAARRRLIL